jgi:hypothetical protein
MLARSLGMDDASERLLYYLLPGLRSPVESSHISDALYRDTLQHLNCGMGLRQWRQITVALSQANKDPCAGQVAKNDIHNIVRGHSNTISDRHYGATSEKPAGAIWNLIFACERLSAWWQHLTG